MHQYRSELSHAIGEYKVVGVITYIMLTIIAVVVAPISAGPLIPISAAIWGPFWTAVMSIIGWTIGSLIAFGISRHFGYDYITRFISPSKIEAIEKRLPKKNVFGMIVLLRILIPADILSYILGLFKSISWKTYAHATIIGVTPFAFIFAYVGALSLKYQLLAFAIGIALFFVLIHKKSDFWDELMA